jgi:copper resistance protein C
MDPVHRRAARHAAVLIAENSAVRTHRLGITPVIRLAFAMTMFCAAPAGQAAAHAFLDHAQPAVGGTLPTSPPDIRLWFTQQLEPAFSSVTVIDKSGNRVDNGDAAVDANNPSELRATLKKLPAGTYKVRWHVVSVDTHPTHGDFTFEVGP